MKALRQREDRPLSRPQLLSLGTRQQLYIALRVALLITAENVGRSRYPLR